MFCGTHHGFSLQAQQQRESTRQREAYFLEYAVKIQAAMKYTPVMVTGGWRSVVAMETAIRNNECALIGLGRPLCGDPAGARKLLDGSIEKLPRYEDTLQVFHWSLQWIFWVPVKLVGAIHMLSQQSWYYRNLVSIAQTGEPALHTGCFTSLLANMEHEKQLAGNMKGEVRCNGTIHKGL